MSTTTGRFKLIRLLRAGGVPDRHILATLQSELGLTADEAKQALRDEPRSPDPPAVPADR